MDALMACDWPGNIRELENFVERAVILTPGETLTAPLAELRPSRVRLPAVLSFRDSERRAIIDALKVTQGKISGRSGAAERLGLKRTTLHTKMQRLGIAPDSYRR